jgi:hypothetical protein
MRKCVIIALLLLCGGKFLFSVSALSGTTHGENWLTLNFQYGFFIKSPLSPDATADNQFDSLGMGLNYRSYSNWNSFGFFLHTYFLFPGKLVSTKTGGLITTEEKIDALMGLIIGPSYRMILGGGSYIYFGLGFHIDYILGSYTLLYPGVSGTFQYDLSGFSLGAGGEFGFKQDLSEIIHLDFGLTWVLDLGGSIFLSDPNRVVPKYAWLHIKPYIGIGITITTDSSWYIKIENEEF